MRVSPTELVELKRDERGRRITPEAEREAEVRAYEQSGLTQKAFARREGIKYLTLVSWLQRRRRKETAAVGPTFAEFRETREGQALPLAIRLPSPKRRGVRGAESAHRRQSPTPVCQVYPGFRVL